MLNTARPVHVLIADDEPVARQVFSVYLESFGCRVTVTCDGHEALAAYGDGSNSIQLIILDALMPGPPPLQLFQQIRRINSRVPILFCSGVSPDDPLIHSINQAGLQLLRKPFGRPNLIQAVTNVLKLAETSAIETGHSASSGR